NIFWTVLRHAYASITGYTDHHGDGIIEIATSTYEQHQIRLQAKQIAQALIETYLDLALGRDQAIQGAIPGTQLAKVHFDALVGMPVRQEASALAIADEVGLQPAGQAMLAGRTTEPIGQQHE